MHLKSTCKTFIADLTSPVSVYLRLRDRFPRCFLLESADFHSADDCRSFIGCDPIAEYRVQGGTCTIAREGEEDTITRLDGPGSLATSLNAFLKSFTIENESSPKGVVNGALGYFSWDSIELMENIKLYCKSDPEIAIPSVHFIVFRNVLAFNHFRNEVHVLRNSIVGEQQSCSVDDVEFAKFVQSALDGPCQSYPFRATGAETGSVTDEQFLEFILQCKKHIALGDVFQIVPSRRYYQKYEGDDFQVYRALRSINPSPYLFYCDFGGFRVFGSSPEAQIIVKDETASIFPIAGTYPRSGDDSRDREQAMQLLEDEKENAEHAMLVDLARNDLSKHCKGVNVSSFKEVQYFSHVIHLVSKVVGRLPPGSRTADVICDSYPLGTLSGTPKHRAMQLLDTYEPIRRNTYGGCVGLLGFNGDAVLGIMIRSFLSMGNTLMYQVGMGIVSDSVPEKELAEGHAKLGALRAAIRRAGDL